MSNKRTVLFHGGNPADGPAGYAVPGGSDIVARRVARLEKVRSEERRKAVQELMRARNDRGYDPYNSAL